MGKHFYDPLLAHLVYKAHDSTRMSAHGLFSLSDQMQPPKLQKPADDKDNKCSFLQDAIALLTRH